MYLIITSNCLQLPIFLIDEFWVKSRLVIWSFIVINVILIWLLLSVYKSELIYKIILSSCRLVHIRIMSNIDQIFTSFLVCFRCEKEVFQRKEHQPRLSSPWTRWWYFPYLLIYFDYPMPIAINLTSPGSNSSLEFPFEEINHNINIINPILSVVLSFCCIITVLGNVLVIYAVMQERYLKSGRFDHIRDLYKNSSLFSFSYLLLHGLISMRWFICRINRYAICHYPSDLWRLLAIRSDLLWCMAFIWCLC